MKFETLDAVVLRRNLPKYRLRKGDMGAVVQVYGADGVEVEFVTASGLTAALFTLETTDVRLVTDTDLVAVRPFKNRSA